MKNAILLFFGLMLLPYGIRAQPARQHLRAEKPFYQLYEAAPQAAIRVPKAASAVVLEADTATQLAGSFVVAEGDTLWLQPDPHDESPDPARHRSALLLLPPATADWRWHPAKDQALVAATLHWHVLFAPPLAASPPAAAPVTEEDCTEPPAVPQSVWRAGLPVPNYTRVLHTVRHVAIHHSATDNNFTDYLNVVRNIYLFHIQVNNYSDMGYNYLVAPDGTLFAGRDPGALPQADVIGAHFCSKNTGTMGVCLLGTFTEIPPTDTALGTLVRLTTWKLHTENLDPLASFPHPVGDPEAQPLGVIAGHRDGCATECPGAATYALLPAFRLTVNQQLTTCAPTSLPVTRAENWHVFPQPAQRRLSVVLPVAVQLRAAYLTDATGRQHALDLPGVTNTRHDFRLPALPAGLYVLELRTATARYAGRVIIQ